MGQYDFPSNRFHKTTIENLCVLFRLHLQNNIQVFPNPANDFIRISLLDKRPVAYNEWKLLDLNGKNVLQGKTDKNVFDIDMRSLQPGIYLLQCSDGKNQRVIKQ